MRNNSDFAERIGASLVLARVAMNRGDYRNAEKWVRSALRQADYVVGRDSALSGLVLLDLHDIFERQEKWTAASSVWKQIQHVANSILE